MRMSRLKYCFAGLLLFVSILSVTPVLASTSAPVFTGTVTIPKTHGVCGIYVYQPFNASAGQVLAGSLSANNTVNVYVMTAAEFNAWQHQVATGPTCTPPHPTAVQINTTNYTLSVTIPTTGTYYLVINNLSPSTATTKISANLT